MADEGVRKYYENVPENGKLRCKYCKWTLSVKSSTKRLKAHLAKEKRQGIRPCPDVPPHVMETNKRWKVATEGVLAPPNVSNFQTGQTSDAVINRVSGRSGSRNLQQPYPLPQPCTNLSQTNAGASQCLPQQQHVTNPQHGVIYGASYGLTPQNICSQRIDDANQYPSPEPILLTTTNSALSSGSATFINLNDSIDWNILHPEPMTNSHPTMPSHPHLAHQKKIGHQNQFEGTTQATMPPNENGSNLPPEGAVGQVDLVSQVAQQDWQQTLALLMNDDLPELAPHTEIESLKETRGVAFPTKKLVGQMFKRNKDKLWSLLKKDEVSSIGIYGMGGVGKTELMTHVHNRLLKGTSAFGDVSWVTVSQDFSIPKLQNLIAKTIHLDLSHEEDEKKRAAKLFEALKKKKSVIILDDLWHNFIPKDVGIPVRVDACKLIVTSRSVEVCRGMGCQKMMRIEPLSEEEAWTLFEEKLGCHVQLPSEVTPIARSVAKECDGLPLGIITMAASMRGVDDVHEWRNVLTELKESKVGKDDMEHKVFKILKYSYDRLNDQGLQQSFLYCALFPEDCCISREDLINFMISEGIIKKMTNRQAECDKCHAILNKLENVCLLEAASSSLSHHGDGRCVKMHDLIRDMAIQIMAESSRAMVEAGAQLTELPDEEKWTCDLVRVSLMNNNIQEILSSPPSCPVLSTLLLRGNLALKVINDSFFQQFCGLKVLDISDTAIRELPSSISDLVNLIALLLRNCKHLRHLPSLAKLSELKMLDASDTGLEKVPQGMERLSKLRYLNINNVRLKAFPTGILPHLLCLQSLNLSSIFIAKPEELAFLKLLETLGCCFNNLLDFNTHLKSCEEKHPQIGYDYTIGGLQKYLLDVGDSSKDILVVNCNISRDLVLPKCIKKLKIKNCQDVRSLCRVSSLKNAPELKCLNFEDCYGMECLLESSCSPNILESIDTLGAWSLKNLSFLIGAGVAPEPLAFSSTFSCLKILNMFYCPSITKLFPHSLLQNLQNLEQIAIGYCMKMEEIMATGEGDALQDSISMINTEVRLPKLKCLILRDLPELKSICSETLICDSLQEIRFVNCMRLKKIPLFLPLPSVAKIQANPKDWWKSLEWSHPNAFDILSPFCVFHKKEQRGLPKAKKAGKSMESLASANAS